MLVIFAYKSFVGNLNNFQNTVRKILTILLYGSELLILCIKVNLYVIIVRLPCAGASGWQVTFDFFCFEFWFKVWTISVIDDNFKKFTIEILLNCFISSFFSVGIATSLNLSRSTSDDRDHSCREVRMLVVNSRLYLIGTGRQSGLLREHRPCKWLDTLNTCKSYHNREYA